MAQAIKAIETSYKGHRFRSRLEARWAVFFDKLRWKWRYEHQGYVIGYADDTLPWLPDFEVITPSGQHFYVEVKGDPNFFDENNMWLDKLDFGGGPPGFTDCAYEKDLGPDVKPIVLLGDLPDVLHSCVGMSVCVIAHRKGVGAFFLDLNPHGLDTQGFNRSEWHQVDAGVGLKDFQARTYPLGHIHGTDIADALLGAKRARFEHGESGA